MLSIGLEDALLLVVMWLVCGGVSMWVFMRPAIMRFAGEAVIKKILTPDDSTKAAISALLAQMIASEIVTGKTIRDGNGKEIPESIPFVRYLGREVWNYVALMTKAARGGKTTQVANDLGIALPGEMFGPKKGQTTSDFILEQMTIRLGPKLEELIGAKLNDMVNKGTM